MKQQTFTPQEKLAQLNEIEKLIEHYLNLDPGNTGSYEHSFARFSRPLRYGIVFMRRGRGWQVHKNWQKTLEAKRRELREQTQLEWTIDHSKRLFEILEQLQEQPPILETLFDTLAWAEERLAQKTSPLRAIEKGSFRDVPYAIPQSPHW